MAADPVLQKLVERRDALQDKYDSLIDSGEVAWYQSFNVQHVRFTVIEAALNRANEAIHRRRMALGGADPVFGMVLQVDRPRRTDA